MCAIILKSTGAPPVSFVWFCGKHYMTVSWLVHCRSYLEILLLFYLFLCIPTSFPSFLWNPSELPSVCFAFSLSPPSWSHFCLLLQDLFFLFLLNLCVCVFALLPHSVCMFLFTERTKECVWWGDIGCIGAPRAQEETQMCAAMRGSYLSKAHTPFTHAYTHTHRNTHVFKYIHPCLSQTPLPCSAKAAWQHCFPCGRLGRKQPTKFQIILCNNNNQASPLRLSSG